MTARDRYIVMTGWRRFQHYKDRNPVWIKNYVELLHDDQYMNLSSHRRGVLHGLWLEYASSRCRLRVDTKDVSRRLSVRVTRQDLEALRDAGFIEYSLAPGKQDASNSASATRAREREEKENQEEEQTKGVTVSENPPHRKARGEGVGNGLLAIGTVSLDPKAAA